MIKNITNNSDTNILLNAAIEMGWNYKIITDNYPHSIVIITKNKLRYIISKGQISVNTNVSSLISKNKYLTNLFLKESISIINKGEVFEIFSLTDKKIKALLLKHKNIVIKPVDENNSVGVVTNIKNLTKAKKAINTIKSLNKKEVLIEPHIYTKREYRIILWKGKIIDVIERIPAFVNGDGVQTIKQLIDNKNKLRKKLGNNLINEIKINEDLIKLIKKNKLTINYIPNKNEKIVLRDKWYIKRGGETTRIKTNKVHPEYSNIFNKIPSLIGANYCGVDLMTNDISSSPLTTLAIINEINGAPGVKPAFMADILENKHLFGSKKILREMEKNPVNQNKTNA